MPTFLPSVVLKASRALGIGGPRTAIGAGIGAGVGAVTGAATAAPGNRVQGALKGGLLGGAVGAGAHGAARFSKLKYVPTAERAQAAFLGKGNIQQTAQNLRLKNPFHGLNPAEAKAAYRTSAQQAHPDRGGTNEAFDTLTQKYRAHQSNFPMPKKQADLALDSGQWGSFFDEIQKLANVSAIKSPAIRNVMKSIRTPVPKPTFSPQAAGRMPAGQSAASATMTPLPTPATT